MIEVLFSESEAGSMKVAKEYRSPPFEENESEVIALPFMLQIGDIQESIESTYRKNLIYEMYSIDGIEESGVLAELKQVGDKYVNQMNLLKEYIYQGEYIRIWYSNAPYSICGLYHLCHILYKYSSKLRVSAIKLPMFQEIDKNHLQLFSNWGEVMAGKFFQFLPLHKELSKNEIQFFSNKWNDLVDDNSPIRTMLNGHVLGVSEDFYDFIIRKEMPKEEIKMARLIGNILGKYPLGVSDWWYAKRILTMIKQGEFIIVEDSDKRYGKTIKKRK